MKKYKMNKKVFIILLNYNSYEDTIECVESIAESEKELNYKIIIVDNNSTDDSKEKLANDLNYIYLQANENGGFAKGNNIGIKYAMENGADYILLLNNDTIIEKNSISKMIKEIEKRQNVGAIGCRIMYYDNKKLINYNGGKINWLKASTIHEDYKKEYKTNGQDFKYTEFITGCCMLIKKEVIEKVGLLPEEYFMYYEDLDYCIKVKEAGYKLGVLTTSVIYHKVSSSSGGENSPFSIKWGNRNRRIFIEKYKKYTKRVFTIITYYITREILFIKYKLKKQNEKAQAIKDGIKEGSKYLRGKNNG